MLYGLTLMLLASLCWAGLDGLRKHLVRDVEPLTLTAALCFGQSILFAILFIKDGMPIPSEIYWKIGIFCSLISLCAAIGLNWSLRLSPLSQSIPMLSLTPAFALIHGNLLLRESMSDLQMLGLLLSAVGAVGFGLEKGWSKSKGAYIMVGVAFLFSLTMALDKLALQHAKMTSHALFQASLITVVLAGYLLFKGQTDALPILWNSKKTYVCAVLLFTLAVAFQLEAVQWLPISLLEAGKRCIGLFSSIVVGLYFFSEPISRKKMASAVLLAIGVCIVLMFPNKEPPSDSASSTRNGLEQRDLQLMSTIPPK